MQTNSYMLLHRMIGAARTKDEFEIVLRRFQEIIKANKDSTDSVDLFDAAWAMSCAGGLYLRLNEPFLAERTYVEAIKLFDMNNMPDNAATICVALAQLLVQQGRRSEAEAQLKDNIQYLVKYWPETSHWVVSAKEELRHFQQTGKFVRATNRLWFIPCGVDFEEDQVQTPEIDDIWPV